jgi:hypothetical protein
MSCADEMPRRGAGQASKQASLLACLRGARTEACKQTHWYLNKSERKPIKPTNATRLKKLLRREIRQEQLEIVFSSAERIFSSVMTITEEEWRDGLVRLMTTAAATTARLDRELKVPKFKRCKISRQQLYVLLTNFGARRSCPAPHSNLISP